MMGHARLKKQQRGVAAVEFGILVVPLLLMLLGLFEYGRAIYQYNTLTKSVRDATRYLSTVAPGSGDATAECLVLYGEQTQDCPDGPGDANFKPLVPNLKKGMISICDASKPLCADTHKLVSTTAGVAVNLVTVEIRNYQFESLFNFTIGGLNIGAPYITYDAIGNTMRQVL